MKPFAIISLLLGIVSAVPMVEEPATASALEPRANATLVKIKGFDDFQLTGESSIFTAELDKCTNLPSGRRDKTRSVVFDCGYKCTFYRKDDCRGAEDTNNIVCVGPSQNGNCLFSNAIQAFRLLLRNHARSVECTERSGFSCIDSEGIDS